MVQFLYAPPFPEQTEQEYRQRHSPAMGAFNSISNAVCDALARAQETDAQQASHLINKLNPKKADIVKHLTQAEQDSACAFAYTSLNPTTASLQSLATLSERLDKAKLICSLPASFWLVVKLSFEVANLPAPWLDDELGGLPDLRALEQMCNTMKMAQTRHEAALRDVAGEQASAAGHARDLDGLLDIACRDYDCTWLVDVAVHIGAAAGESFAALLHRLAAICDDAPFLNTRAFYTHRDYPHEHTPPFCQTVQPRCFSALWSYAEYGRAMTAADEIQRKWHAKLGSGRSAFDDLADVLEIIAAFLSPKAAARLLVTCRFLSRCPHLQRRAPFLDLEVQHSSPEKKSSQSNPIQFLPSEDGSGYAVLNSTVHLTAYVRLASQASVPLCSGSLAAREGMRPGEERWPGVYRCEGGDPLALPPDGPTRRDVDAFAATPCHHGARCSNYDDTVQADDDGGRGLAASRVHTGQVQPTADAAGRARFKADLVPLGTTLKRVDAPSAATAAIPLKLFTVTASPATTRRGEVPQPRLYNLASDQSLAAVVVVNLSKGACGPDGDCNFTSLCQHSPDGRDGRSVYCIRVTAYDAESKLAMGSAVTPPFVVSGRSKKHARAPRA